MKAIIFISSAGPHVWKECIEITLISLEKSLEKVDHQYYIAIDKDETEQIYRNILPTDKIYQVEINKESWVTNFNLFWERCKNLAEYIIETHDDVTLTQFSLEEIDNLIKNREDIGIVCITNDHYYQFDKDNTLKAGFYIDQDQDKMFECHTKTLPWDYPKGPIICYGPFSHFLLFKNDTFAKIDNILPNLSCYTMLTDDDLCLRFLTKGYKNIWIPNMFLTHPNIPKTIQIPQSRIVIRDEARAHAEFNKIWRLNTRDGFLDFKAKYPHLSYLMGKQSYDWQYL